MSDDLQAVDTDVVATSLADNVAPTIDAQVLYWSLLPDAKRLSASAQDYRFERVIPVPVETLHCSRTTLADGGVLIAGIDRDALRAHIARRSDITPDCWRLVPDIVPEHLFAAGVSDAAAAELNFLHGEFEPAPRRRLRRITAAIPLAAATLVALLVVIGVERRCASLHAQATAVRQASDLLLDRVVPPTPGAAALPAAARLTMELRRLGQAHHSAGEPDRYQDATSALEALWAHWPADQRVQVDTLTATAQRLILRGRTVDLAGAERLARAVDGGEAGGVRWRAQPVQASQGAAGAEFAIALDAVLREANPVDGKAAGAR